MTGQTDPDLLELSEWKPMKEAFYSHTNMYSLDPDDAEVILTGYSELHSVSQPQVGNWQLRVTTS